ncbi:IS1 family transposase [Vibrio parahaemolyticus]|uniref:IS1 family transposase n=1 Tax=Vibrio parahaemolyticus TaxID=670 RepID=UPI0018A6C47D|nr:IS1 family transposase [Vibrio parahaemolyticus]EHK2862681.1 IS1 family transposase [Vibrio parahaemolyticus]EHK2865893.1 IS1 family transposase [Vibrio parahaemolyticus]EHK9098558.1 IS1 family transposase [Vibrio parahaemolyticus]EIA1334029.1 IS1 family transposase [Vibrio parahaemolyticus]EIT7133743.1 IS1 family transposase [Vibrio parahaemolyticus]
MATIQVNCRFCNQTEFVRKHGTGVSGFQRFRCLKCKRSFQLDYAYEAYKPNVKEQIIDMAMNSSGVRETSRVLKVGYNTVLRTFKKLSPRQVTSIPFDKANIELICEVDEQWSFVSNKKNRRWLWYAWEPRYKRIIAHTFGKRNTDALRALLTLLKPFDISFFFTDDFSVYSKELPKAKHVVGKRFTQRIERTNLTLRSRLKRLARKTIGFSKSEEMHDKVIGTFIEREFYH